MMRALAAAGVLAMFLAATACSALRSNFIEPEIELDHAVLRGIGVSGGLLDLVVRVGNPNRFRLEGTRLQVGFDVEGSNLGEITYDDDFVVPGDSVTMITLPLRFNWTGVGSAVRAALGYGDFPYEMDGQATIKTPWGRTVVEFSRGGRVPLTRATGRIAIPGVGS